MISELQELVNNVILELIHLDVEMLTHLKIFHQALLFDCPARLLRAIFAGVGCVLSSLLLTQHFSFINSSCSNFLPQCLNIQQFPSLPHIGVNTLYYVWVQFKLFFILLLTKYLYIVCSCVVNNLKNIHL